MRTVFLTILIKLKVTHKNIALWSFSPYFLFLMWFKFHIVFIFLHSLCPHPETTEGFLWRGEYCISLPGRCQLVPARTFFVAFCWNDTVLSVFTFARIVLLIHLLAPNP